MKFHSTRSIITDLGIKMEPEPEPEADRQTKTDRQTETDRQSQKDIGLNITFPN